LLEAAALVAVMQLFQTPPMLQVLAALVAALQLKLFQV
jgi:hypothetical protein